MFSITVTYAFLYSIVNEVTCCFHSDQPPVVIVGETNVVVGGILELQCLLNRNGNIDNDNLPYNPQWKKGSGSLPDHVTVV